MVLTVAASSRCKPMITIGTRTEGWGGGGHCSECCWQSTSTPNPEWPRAAASRAVQGVYVDIRDDQTLNFGLPRYMHIKMLAMMFSYCPPSLIFQVQQHSG